MVHIKLFQTNMKIGTIQTKIENLPKTRPKIETVIQIDIETKTEIWTKIQFEPLETISVYDAY